MMRFLVPLLALVALSACCSTCCTEDCCGSACEADCDATCEEGWTDLSSLEAWRGYKKDGVPDQWVIDDGAIHLTAGGAGDLITREQYESFELQLEWKISPKGNSGIMYHVAETDGATYMTGPEMQVLDNSVAGGDLSVSAGADYALHAPAEDNTRPVGEWNEASIKVDGPHVEYWLNGVKQCEYELWGDAWNEKVQNSKFKAWPEFGQHKTGHIALQDHGNPVWYRNARIREL